MSSAHHIDWSCLNGCTNLRCNTNKCTS